MSVYNSNVTSKIIDPVYDKSNFRSEYRFDSNSVYLSNFRITGMGIKTSAENSYNPLLGAFCIKSLQLYDGNQLLDQVLSADLWRAFTNFNNSNDENISVNSVLNRSSYGFVVNTINQSTDPWQEWDGASFLPKIGDIKINTFDLGMMKTSQTDGDPVSASWMSLKGFLAFLSSSLYVPTAIYKNLRLVINWKNNAELKKISLDPSLEYDTFTNVALIVDQVTDEKTQNLIVNNYKGVVYKPVEHDQVVVNAIAPQADSSLVQRNRFLINGFNNKTVERLVVIQTPTDASTYDNTGQNDGVGIVGSFAQLNSEFQFRVNGQNKLPRDGFTGKNQRLAALVDTYGESSLTSFANFVYVPKLEQNLFPLADGGFTTGMQGQLDWTAIQIRDNVKELVVEYNRTGVHGNDILNQALRLNLFAEVVKAVSVDKNKNYIVSYL